MADSKITALTALGAAPATGDLFVVVDISDTTMSANGTNKKVTAANLLSGLLTATGTTTGATSQAQTFTNGIIGPTWKPASNSTTALQMTKADGTSILNVDTTNNRVGIGLVSPSVRFHVSGATQTDTLAVTSTATITTSVTVPTVYGSSSSNGTLYLESTSHATKGAIVLNPTSGFVGINTAPTAHNLEISNSDAGDTSIGITNPNDGTSAYVQIAFSAGTSSPASGSFQMFGNSYTANAALTGRMVLRANSTATGVTLYSTAAGQTINFYAGNTTKRAEITSTGMNVTGVVDISSTATIGGVYVDADPGGVASTIGFSSVSDLSANSSGVGTIAMKGTTSRNSSGFIKIYIGTIAYYLPAFSAITG